MLSEDKKRSLGLIPGLEYLVNLELFIAFVISI